MANYQLNRDINLIDVLENDLVTKAKAAYAPYPEIDIDIYGVFSLDHLEQLQESSLSNQLALGVAYLGAERTSDIPGVNVDRGPLGVRMVTYSFIIVVAAPVTDQLANRHSATRLLTILRNKILGTFVVGDNTQRAWNIVREKPEISESNRNMLYYSQVWQVAMPTVGNLS